MGTKLIGGVDEIRDLKDQLKAEVVRKMERERRDAGRMEEVDTGKAEGVVGDGRGKKTGWFW